MRVIDAIINSSSKNSFVFDGKTKISTYELMNLVSLYSSQIDSLVSTDRVSFVAINRITTLILMLASMLSGKTYCPLYQHFSDEKVKFISDEIEATYISTDETDIFGFAKFFSKKVNIQNITSGISVDRRYTSAATGHTNIEDVYIIYTSGTEGISKGCIINNENLENYCKCVCSIANISNKDISLVTTSLAFDLAYTSIFPILLTGGSICLFDNDKHLDSDLVNFIIENNVTVMKTTPGILRMMSKSLNIEKISSLRCIFSGGEGFDYYCCKKIYHIIKNCSFYNHYGPTEATIGCCIGSVNFNKSPQEAVAVYPIDNVSISVKNSLNIDAEIGEKGELIISGKCLGRYVSEQDNRKFNKEYHTGDIAYFTPDGGIVIIGRINNIVKISGYRINTDIVTKYIRDIDIIDDAICAFDNETKLYICFFVSKEKLTYHIKEKVKPLLSSYEIPPVFFPCEEIPKNANGKVDISVLFDKYKKYYESSNCYELIESFIGLNWDSIKDEMIESYLSSMEYIELLASLSDKMSLDLFSSGFHFKKFSDIIDYANQQNQDTVSYTINEDSIIMLCGGDNQLEGIQYEIESLSKILVNYNFNTKNRVLVCTLHSSTPIEYGNILKNIFEKYKFIFDMIGYSDLKQTDLLYKKILDSDIIYLSGGDYCTLFELIDSHIISNRILVESIKHKVLMGLCSGAGIFCNSFFSDNYEHDLSATKRFEFQKGYGLMDYSLSPHFASEPKRSVALLNELKQKNYDNVFAFEDGVGIIINKNKDYELIASSSNSKVYLLSSVNGIIHRKTLPQKGNLNTL